MPRTAERLPQSTCGDLEAIFDSLASTGQYSAVLGHEAVAEAADWRSVRRGADPARRRQRGLTRCSHRFPFRG